MKSILNSKSVTYKHCWITSPFRGSKDGVDYGKEKDEETGYSYFGARYLSSEFSIWLSVDPMSDKYANISSYAYCNWNPVMLVDPDGRDWYKGEGENFIWQKGDAENIEIKGEAYKRIGPSYSYTTGNTTYNYGNSNQVESISTSTMTPNDWVSQYSKPNWNGTPASKACNKACDVMLSNVGASSNGIDIIANNAGFGRAGTANNNASSAINDMSTAIDLGKPTKVNVDYRSGTASGDGMGDHFIVVQGKTETIKNGKVTSTNFNFYDPGTRIQSKGTSLSNILNIVNGRLVGSHINNGKPIVVSSIRPSR